MTSAAAELLWRTVPTDMTMFLLMVQNYCMTSLQA